MKTLYLDISNGISGDMFLAALCGLGLDLAPFEEKLVGGGLVRSVSARHISRDQFSGLELSIEELGDQPLRHLEEMFEAVKRLQLSDPVWAHTRHALMRLAEAEALAHGISLDEVHFHEVGGVDTIVDVAGAFWGLDQLGILGNGQVLASPVPWFEGTAETCHGTISLPAPATLRLLEKKPTCGVRADWEIITPTGALLLDCLVDEFCSFPSGVLERSALSFGTNPKGKGMRAFLLETDRQAAGSVAHNSNRVGLEEVWVLESHIDHLSGEEIGVAIEGLMAAGALDVLFMPGIMKKNRPGGCLRLICREDELTGMESAFFSLTHTLGIRRRKETRRVLPRRQGWLGCPELSGLEESIETKIYSVDGQEFQRPEMESLKAAAQKTGLTNLEIKAMLFKSAKPPKPGNPKK